MLSPISIKLLAAIEIALLTNVLSATEPTRLPVVEPVAAGIRPGPLAAIEPLISAAMEAKQLPGCVLCLGRRGKIFWLKAYGNRRVEPTPEPMTLETVFDLASLSKPIATATSVMLLVERGVIELDKPVATYLPDFAVEGKQAITMRQLLIHTSGLIPDNPLRDYEAGADEAWKRIFALKPLAAAGTRFAYSDVNFLVLGKLVEQTSGEKLDAFANSNIFEPLGMHETGYLPSAALRARTAPTEKRDGEWIQGEVHDPRARKLGGVAGHAGLFSTANDIALYADALLHDASGDNPPRVLKRETLRQMIKPHEVTTARRDKETTVGLRGLGWDMRTGYSINRGENWSASAFGHGGFAGTVLWIDPENDLFLIFLSNRLHPDGKGNVNRLAGAIGTLAASAAKDGQ